MNLVRQMYSRSGRPMKLGPLISSLYGFTNMSKQHSTNQLACSSMRIPRESRVKLRLGLSGWLLSSCREYWWFRDLRKTSKMSTSYCSSPRSIFLTSRQVNLAMIRSMVTVLIPFSFIFSGLVLSSSQLLVLSPMSPHSSAGKMPNTSPIEQVSSFLTKYPLKVLNTLASASSGVLRCLSLSLSASSRLMGMELLSLRGIVICPEAGVWPWCLFLMCVYRAGQLKQLLPQGQTKSRQWGSLRARRLRLMCISPLSIFFIILCCLLQIGGPG